MWRKIKFEGQSGCPDILIAHKGRIIFVELKSPTKKGRLSEIQKRQIKHFKNAGIKVHVVDRQTKYPPLNHLGCAHRRWENSDSIKCYHQSNRRR